MAEPLSLPADAPEILAIHLELSQYPILSRQIRKAMRQELYSRGVVSRERLHQEAREKAAQSQLREGMTNPLYEEDETQWQQRLQIIRDSLTDFYFAYNLPLDLFHEIVESLIRKRSPQPTKVTLTFNPELAPMEMLLQQAKQYEALPPDQQTAIRHHLEEIHVVLTKTIISDQLRFIRVAKQWLDYKDFQYILGRRIGGGKIGGKAGGMFVAWKILRGALPPELAERITIPESYFLGADVFYDFMDSNELKYVNQKYKTPEQIQAEYPQIQQEYERGRFPEETANSLREILAAVGRRPLIVRSSSLLEDNFGTSFAGKYDSFFCPNQGTPTENLRDLTRAIRRTYASVLSPNALLYRRRMGLLDYDERMAILLQVVEGQPHGRYFFPTLAGVAFSYSPIVWSPRLRREDGFVRLVMGLGTRAVDRVADDHPRLITLSHPALRPETKTTDIRRNSQRIIDVIDLKANRLAHIPVSEILDVNYPPLRWLASVDEGDTLTPILSLGPQIAPDRLVLTFDNLIQRSDFVLMLKNVLSTLGKEYGMPVDMEFAITATPASPKPHLQFHLLQCRPQSNARGGNVRELPPNIGADDRLFVATRMVPQGDVSGIEYIVYVLPEVYGDIADPARRSEIARAVGRLNKALEGKGFILIGPGRWGSVNANLGVPVGYADIFNAKAIIELAVPQQGIVPEPSYGTHFFQDLVEAQIYPVAIYPGEGGDSLNTALLNNALNCLSDLLPDDTGYAGCVKLIHLPTEREGYKLELIMDGVQAIAFLAKTEPS
jgi:hypothetical protein